MSAVIIAGVHMSDLRFQETQVDGIKFINCQFNGSTNGIPEGVTVGICTHTKKRTFEGCQSSNISSGDESFGFFVERIRRFAGIWQCA